MAKRSKLKDSESTKCHFLPSFKGWPALTASSHWHSLENNCGNIHRCSQKISEFTDRQVSYSAAGAQTHQKHNENNNIWADWRLACDRCLRNLISVSPPLWLSHEAGLYHPPHCLRAAYGDAGPAQTGRATYCCHDTSSVKHPSKRRHNDKDESHSQRRTLKKTTSRLFGQNFLLSSSQKLVISNKITKRRRRRMKKTDRQTENDLWSVRNLFEKHASCTFMANHAHIR